MTQPLPIITLTTDFGHDSHYVGQMKGAILAIAPDVQIVDITHGVPAQDVRSAAWIIGQSVDAFPTGAIHVVVIDPGVGSKRSLLCAKTEIGYFVAPNNGVMTRVFDRFVPLEIVQLTASDFWRNVISSTFHGRDIMGPVAAHLSQRVALAEFGPPLDKLQRIVVHSPVHGKDLVGAVEFVDSFGNLVTNIALSDLEQLTERHERAEPIGDLQVTVASYRLSSINRCYADVSDGQLLALVGSGSMLEIAVAGGNAAEQCGIRTGDRVQVRLPRSRD